MRSARKMEFAKIDSFQLINGKLPSLTSLGIYPLFYLDGRDNALCPDCATEYLEDPDANFRPTGGGVNWENSMYCERCSKQIEAAYDVVELETVGNE